MRKTRKLPKILWISLPIIFLYLPMLVMAVFSFNDSKSLSSWNGFSFRWYETLFNNSQMMHAILVSVTVAVIATIIATILGTITAIGLSKSRRVVKQTILQINNLPIMNPDIVTAVSLMILFSFIGINKGYLTMLLAHIAFCTPFVITNVYPKVKQLDANLADAAMDLGATPFEALTKVIIPQIKSGIFAGALLSFTMSFDDFIISYFVSGNGVENISIVVYNMAKRTNPSIYALATIILIVVFAVTFIPYFIVKMIDRKEKGLSQRIGNNIMNKVSNLGWKKLTAIFVAFCLVLGVFFFTKVSKPVLKVFNAGEYIDLTVIDDFEKEFNCTVVYETFDSNESMYTKYMGGNEYDVLVPSDYMVERLINEESLQKIDKKIVTNIDKIDSSLLDLEYDPGNTYSIPYFCGNVGIVYDTTVVDEADLQDGWNILQNPKYRDQIYMYDSERDSFMVALKAVGYSMNTKDDKELDDAYNWLVQQRDTVNPVYVGDECIDNMTNGLKAMAVMYSGDAAFVMEENENLDFFMPEGGTNYWFDSFVITKECSNSELANQFINYMISDDIALRNTTEVGYLSANTFATNTAREQDYQDNSAFGIRMDANDEFFRAQDNATKEKYNSRWVKVTAQ